MRAIKIYQVPESLEFLIKTLDSLGVDTLLLGCDCAQDKNFLAELKSKGIRRSLIEPIFLASEGDSSSEMALDAQGEPVVNSWVRFACPHNHLWQTKVFERLARNARLGLEGQSLDFIRFFQFWEIIGPKVPATDLVRTCYCPDCAKSFAEFAMVPLPKWWE